MTLARLELTNFRCFGETGVDFHPRLTFLCAQNAAGKSSILDAVQWCLAGRCRGTDDRGSGSKGLIRAGEDAMTVKAIFDDGTYVARQVARSGSMRADPPEPVVNRDMLRVLMDGAGFLDLAHADAKNLLLAALDVRVPINGVMLTLAEVESQYQMAFAERRDQKVRLNAIQVPPMPPGDTPDIEALEKKLADLRAEEHVLVAKEAHAGGKKGQLEKEVARATAGLEAVQREIVAVACPDDIDAQIEALERDAGARAGAFDTETGLAHHRATSAQQKGILDNLRAVIQGIDQHSPTKGCVLDSTIPCKTPSKAFTEQVVNLKHGVREAERQIADAEAQVQALAVAHTAHTEKVAQYDALTRLRERRGELGAAHTKAVLALAALQRDLHECPADAGPSPELLTLRARITKGDGVIRQAHEIIRQRIDHEDKTQARIAAAEKLQRLEERVELLGPKGVRVGALGEALEAFGHAINAALGAFGYALDFVLDPWGVSVNGRDSALLSTSERLRVGVAFALALATATKIGFVCIDGADLLDGPGRGILAELLLAWSGGQVIVAATRDTPLASSEGMTAYWLAREGDGPTVVTRA